MKKLLLSCVLGWALQTGLFAQIDPAVLPELNARDVLVALECTWMKVRIHGQVDDRVALALLVGEEEKEILLYEFTLLFVPFADLCVIANDREGICGPGKTARVTMNWEIGPISHRVRLDFLKRWNYAKGSTFTSGYTTESFMNQCLRWDLTKEPKCELANISWSPKKLTPEQASRDSSSVKRVAKLVLRKIN